MDAGEVDTLVAHAFKLVLALLGGPRSELLEHAIQECKVGEDQSDLVFLITGFALVRSPSSELPLLALRTLSTLCSAKDPRGQVVSLIGYFGPNPSAYCAEFVQMLGQPDVSEAVQEAVIQFLRAALPFQTALTLQFLNGSPLPEAPSKGTERIEGVPQSSVLTVLVQLVSKVTDGFVYTYCLIHLLTCIVDRTLTFQLPRSLTSSSCGRGGSTPRRSRPLPRTRAYGALSCPSSETSTARPP